MFFVIIFQISCKNKTGVNSSVQENLNEMRDTLYSENFKLFNNINYNEYCPNKLILKKNDSIVNEVFDTTIVNTFYYLLHKKFNRKYHCPSDREYTVVFCKDSIVKEIFRIDRKMFEGAIIFSPPGYNKCVVLKESALDFLLESQ